MSEQTIEFGLTTEAKKSGGDKYTAESDDTFVIYIPQRISRPNGKTASKNITITIKTNE